MRGPDALARKNITLRTGIQIQNIDRLNKTLHFSHGSSLPYHLLAIATGARPRQLPLPGGDVQGVHSLRTLDDCLRIGIELETAERVVVIGGGFIGLEFAAVARKKGKQVTVIEAGDRLMARAVSPFISDWYTRLHAGHGVKLCFNTVISTVDAKNGHVSSISLTDGTSHAADLVVLGIGVIANDGLAAESGLAVDRGVVVDACGRTADPAVFACGDCTATRQAGQGLRRLESVQNAVEQGKAVAAAMLGKEKPFVATPWFWSDQYDAKLQMVGTSSDFDTQVIRGEPDEGKFSVFYFRLGRLIGIDSINRPQDHMLGRKLLDRGLSPTQQQVTDEAFALNSLLA